MDARTATLELLGTRPPDATVCPSEVARRLAGDAADWRARMPEVHAAIDRLLAERQVRLSWRARPMALRSGPYRIGRVAAAPPPG